MDKIYLSTIRDIWFNKTRSLVIILALITVVCFPIAFLNVAPNLTNVIEKEQTDYHLAYFNIFFDRFIDDSVANNISSDIQNFLKISSKDVVVEPRIFQTSKTRSQGLGSIPEGTWIDLDVVLVNSSSPPYVSALKIVEGQLPQSDHEIVLLDSLAVSAGLGLGDSIELYQHGGGVSYQIVGLTKSIEYSSYDLSQTGVVYLSYGGMARLTGFSDLRGLANEVGVYFNYKISLDDQIAVSNYIKKEAEHDGVNIVLFWFVRETSFRKALLDALNLTSQYMAAASVFIFLVAGVVIFVVTNRYITEQKTRIGAMYSFGVRRRQIMYSFFLRTLILSIISIVIGLGVAKLLLGGIIQTLVHQWGLIGYADSITTNSIIFTLISASIVAYLFTFLAVANLIKLTPYEAMRGKTSELKNRGIFFKVSSQLPSKILRRAAKNLTRNRTRTVLTVIAFSVALTFSGSLLYTNQSIGITINNFYTNTIHYDVEADLGYSSIFTPGSTIAKDILTMPDVAQGEYFINSLVQLADKPQILTYLLGLYRNTSMYDLSQSNILEGRWFKQNSSEVTISRYLQGTVGIKIGETFRFNFYGHQINCTVVGITNDIQYSTAVFADFTYLNDIIAKEARKLLDPHLVFANKLLLHLKDGVNIHQFQDDLNSHNTAVLIALTEDSYKRRSLALSESQTAIIFLMVGLGLIVGIVSVFTTLLIAIVERQRELALLQVFGYRQRELLLQVLIEGWIIGLISLIPTFIAARIVAENLWITIISNNIYQVFPAYPLDISIFLVVFAFFAITISIIPAFRAAIKTKISETIREE